MHKVCSRKNCKHNGILQPKSSFYRMPKTYDGLTPECRDCRREGASETKDRKKAERELFKKMYF